MESLELLILLLPIMLVAYILLSEVTPSGDK